MEIALSGGAFPYLEYAWVCAPNAAGQSITANTITTLTLDTEIQDAGGYGSIASNQVTLASGTYYFKVLTSGGNIGVAGLNETLLSLYNVTDSSYISKTKLMKNAGQSIDVVFIHEGQFTIATSKVLDIRFLSSKAISIGTHSTSGADCTVSTAGADQRTTLKLWKLA